MNHNNPRNAINGSLLKTMGMVAGVADMTYLHPDGVKFIEFKVDGGKQSEAVHMATLKDGKQVAFTPFENSSFMMQQLD